MQTAPGREQNPGVGAAAKPMKHWLLLALLVISVCINYIDRGSLGIAAKGLTEELRLNAKTLGILLSAFSWTYAGFQMVAGWAIDRYNVYRLYAICFAVWSAATALTGVAGGFASIFVLRLFLGVAESIAYPAYSK